MKGGVKPWGTNAREEVAAVAAVTRGAEAHVLRGQRQHDAPIRANTKAVGCSLCLSRRVVSVVARGYDRVASRVAMTLWRRADNGRGLGA